MSGTDRRIDRARLAKLLGMMGSAHDGEIAAAARKANAFVKSSGQTWEEVLKPVREVQVVTVASPRIAPDARELIRDIVDSGQPLDAREASFIRDMQWRRTRFTPGQVRWIKMIAVKTGVL